MLSKVLGKGGKTGDSVLFAASARHIRQFGRADYLQLSYIHPTDSGGWDRIAKQTKDALITKSESRAHAVLSRSHVT